MARKVTINLSDRVKKSRASQGLPRKITDKATIAKLANKVILSRRSQRDQG
jgi:hypothetical protein